MVAPYLSVVATARNDDHGLNLLRRMQIFVTGLGAQADRFRFPVELIIVEWNPPVEKPSLAEVLEWPQTDWVQSRVIQVPPALHRRYKHADGLPLYQMIAKNVGIRRARGKFVLATNIDLLFSDELFSFLAARRLETGKMYRVDRWDADAGVPLNSTIREQLDYCASHLLRVNARGETYAVTPEGERVVGPADVIDDTSGESPEEDALSEIPEEDALSEGPEEDASSESPEEDASSESPEEDASSESPAEDASSESPEEDAASESPEEEPPPVLLPTRDSVSLIRGFYALESSSGEPFRWSRSEVRFEVTAKGPNRELCLDIDPTPELGPAELRIRAGAVDATATIDRRSLLSIRADFEASPGVEVHIKVMNQASRTPLTVDPRDLGFRVYSARCAVAPSESVQGIELETRLQPGFLSRLGMFVELWRSGTPGMRLKIPMPGFLLNGLRPRIEEGGVSLAITRPEPTEAEAFGESDQASPESDIPEEPLKADANDSEPESNSEDPDQESAETPDEETSAEDDGRPETDNTDEETSAEDDSPPETDSTDGETSAEDDGRAEIDSTDEETSVEDDGRIETDVKAGETSVEDDGRIETDAKAGETSVEDDRRTEKNATDDLHKNACGDFTLLSLEDWLDLRGYPEWDMYSMNIDSALCISAAHAGIEEVFLTARVYHIEHAAGSGFTPEGQEQLWERLREKGIDWVDYDEIRAMDHMVGRLGSTAIFNRGDWGLIRHTLPEKLAGGQSVNSERAGQSEYSNYLK